MVETLPSLALINAEEEATVLPYEPWKLCHHADSYYRTVFLNTKRRNALEIKSAGQDVVQIYTFVQLSEVS